jgi:Flp pilus assembly pilin Flp
MPQPPPAKNCRGETERPRMSMRFKKFLKSTSGASSIEYGMIAVILSIGIIIGATQIGSSTSDRFDSVSQSMPDEGG